MKIAVFSTPLRQVLVQISNDEDKNVFHISLDPENARTVAHEIGLCADIADGVKPEGKR